MAKRSMSRRNQRVLERKLFWPVPTPAPRHRTPIVDKPYCELPTIGDCRFCGNHAELAYRDDTWICFMCGGIYVFGQTQPTNFVLEDEEGNQ
jgi:hypothetical protein